MANPRYVTAGEYYHGNLFIQFDVNLHDDQDVSSLLWINDQAASQTPIICYQDSTSAHVSGLQLGEIPGFTLDEWHTFKISLYVPGPSFIIGAGSFDNNAFVTDTGEKHMISNVIEEIRFGAVGAGGSPVNHHIRNIMMGTGGFGSDNLFSFDLDSALLVDSILPQFDSVTGDGLSLDENGILFENAGTDVYATKSFIFP